MKNLLLTLVAVIAFDNILMAQVVNKLTISPSNPTANDTIIVISDLSYFGNCQFGLVFKQDWLAGTTINIIPTYCGYGYTTLCNSIDTFKVGPFPNGNYSISIEYHQGGICPASDFDEIIAQVDTFVYVSGTTNIANLQHKELNSLITAYPNPSDGLLTIKFGSSIQKDQLNIYNSIGVLVREFEVKESIQINISELPIGLYFIRLKNNQQQTQKFIKQ